MTDNRGIGFSSIPSDKSQYSTSVMAQDVLLVMDHLGWSQAHVAGFSMGGMIATKLAAAAPHRVSSLSILSVTGGGMEILPRCWRGWKYALKGLMAKTPHERALVDLKLHFSKRTLKLLVSGQQAAAQAAVKHKRQQSGRDEPSSGRRLRQVLYEEYTSRSTGSQPQAESGFTGQGYAVWSHSVSDSDVKRIKSGAMPVWYIHGRHDVLATPRFAEQLAARFGAPCVYVDGAHMTSRENADEVGRRCSTPMTQSSRVHEPQQVSKAPSTYLCLA
ncbi:hypothetical protein QJQ45_026784 [Haematococcus lacustris]|nr:hypothetical protein QJQ45_026784 [Haematococcus lacustris]